MAESYRVDSNQKVREDRNLHRVFLSRQFRERRRERDNWRLYEATNYGQWNEQAVRISVQEGRPLSSYNLAKKMVDTTIGSVIADPFETHFDTELGDNDLIALMLNQKFLEDKDLGGFDAQYYEMVRAGFVFKGNLQPYIDRTTQTRAGTFNVRYIHGDRVVYDPDRRSNDINANRYIFVHAWMSAEQIRDKYEINTPEIRTAIDLWRAHKAGEIVEESQSEQGEEHQLYDRSPEVLDERNGLFLVIDKYWLKKQKWFDVYDPATGTVLTSKPPDEARMMQRAYKLQGIKVQLLERNFKECWFRTTIPGLSSELVIQEGPYELQVDGYPFLEYSSDMINGRPNTYIDTLKDPQVAFNKRKNTETHILMTQSNNALFIESDALDDDDDFHKIGQGRARPGAYYRVASGTMQGKKIGYLEKGSPPNDFLNSASHIRDIMQELTPAVPALQAIGQSQESGVHFQAKVAQAQVALQLPQKNLKIFWERFGNMYFECFKQIYTYPIRFKSSRTGAEFFLNVPGGIDVNALPRMKVTVSQAPSSETYRRQLLQSYLAISQYLRDAYTLSELSRVVIGSLPGIPEEELEKLREAAKLSSEAQKTALEAQVIQAKQIIAQAGAQPMGGGAEAISGLPGTENMPAPGEVDSGRLLEGIIQNVQNNKRGQPSPQGVM